MTRARNLANLGNKNAITADIGLFNIGIGLKKYGILDII